MWFRPRRWLFLALSVFTAAPSFAEPAKESPSQPTAAEKAAAQAKFEEAKKLLSRKKYKEACQLLEESLRLEEGMAARFRLAECYEKAGRLASSWITYVDVADAAQAAKMPDREKVARQRAEALKPRLAQLTIEVPAEVAAISGLTVRKNGADVGQKLWNQPVPVDTGDYEIEATAPGRLPFRGKVTAAGEASSVKIAIAPLAPDPTAKPEKSAEKGSSGPGAQKIAGITLAGVGVLGVAGSVVMGVLAKGQYDGSASHCEGNFCDAEGLQIRSDARSQGDIATVIFVASAVVGAGGAVLWITAPKAPASPAAGVTLGPGHIVLKGAW